MTGPAGRPARRRPRVLIIVQNLPVPFDRRVWLECQALTRRRVRRHRGLPAGQGRPRRTQVHRRRRRSTATGPTRPAAAPRASSLEYAYSFLATARLVAQGPARRAGSTSSRPATRRTSSGRWRAGCGCGTAPGSCSTTTTCAPSCTSRGSPTGAPLARRGLLLLERATFRTADRVTSTNESYAAIAMRARRQGARATSPSCAPAPTPSACSGARARPELRRGRRHLVAYLGVMGPQDGVDLAVRAADHIVHALGPHRHRVHLHGRRRLLRRAGRPARPSSACRTTSSSPAGCPTRPSSTSCRPPTSGCRPTR